MNQTTEITLDEQVELCRKGAAKAYFNIYERYAKAMLNSSMRILNNLADAEDMVQEAFVDAFKNIDSFCYKSSFEAWLKRIVINKSISLIRRRKINWVAINEEVTMEVQDVLYCDASILEGNVQRVKAALLLLPDNYRIVFTLYTIDEIPQVEIGKLLGISHNNVRTLYHRAKNKILETLKQEVNER